MAMPNSGGSKAFAKLTEEFLGKIKVDQDQLVASS